MSTKTSKPSSSAYSSPMSVPGIQGQVLEVTVVACNKLKDTEWISRQDPYVCLEYASTNSRTRTCTDGGKNPTFQERFVFTLIEGLREISIVVWNSNTLKQDDFIGSGKVQLHKVLSQGYDDSPWPLQDRRGRHAGEVRLIMHYANANKPASSYSSSHVPSVPPYSTAPPPPHTASYPPIMSHTTPYHPSYPPSSAPAPPQNYSNPMYPPSSSLTAAYPPSTQPYNQHQTPFAYPPTTYPPPTSDPYSGYPPISYPPRPYPPPPY